MYSSCSLDACSWTCSRFVKKGDSHCQSLQNGQPSSCYRLLFSSNCTFKMLPHPSPSRTALFFIARSSHHFSIVIPVSTGIRIFCYSDKFGRILILRAGAHCLFPCWIISFTNLLPRCPHLICNIRINANTRTGLGLTFVFRVLLRTTIPKEQAVVDCFDSKSLLSYRSRCFSN